MVGSRFIKCFAKTLALLLGFVFASAAISVNTKTGTAGADSEEAKDIAGRFKYECESVPVYNSKGTKKVQNVRQDDPKASGGATAGVTGNKFFVFENVPEANLIHIAYASPNTSTILAQVKYPGSEEYITLCTIEFSTSNSWYMDSSYTATSPVVYIPEGSDVRIKPAVDVNLDCLWFTYEAVSGDDAVPEKAIGPGQFDSGDPKADKARVEDDMMAPGGKCVTVPEGGTFAVKIPGDGRFNVLDLSYSAEDGAQVEIESKGRKSVFALPATPLRVFKNRGVKTEAFMGGDTVTVKCVKGGMRVAYIRPDFAENSLPVAVERLPGAGERKTVVLDGIWDADATFYDVWTVPGEVPEELIFPDSAPVPGLWSNAAYSLGNYAQAMFWLSRKIELAEEPSGTVLLKIGAALYGRYVYVNGKFAGSYEYNYTPSVTDVSGMLHKGTNTLTVMLGNWGHQANDQANVAHVLHDGESTEDEPGIIDSVELIFCGDPAVSAVQTAPDIENGTLDAKITVKNYSEAEITTDVTATVYELGLFENGVAKAEEIKAGELKMTGAAVGAGESLDLYLEKIKLENWSREKCWTPENPFLYRLEIRTAGDVYSVRFGMRTFEFEAGTGYALLNGTRRFLFGTNVAIERFFDDPLRGTNPWNGEWIRKLYSEFRSVNWTCFRTHLGHANSKWFDIADETGMMIFDEYPTWGNSSKDTLKRMLPEIYAWIEDRGNHPSVIVFDAQNESTLDLNDKIIEKGRAYDIQSRPWENGWRPPVGENDPVECHPYIIGSSGISGLEKMTNDRPIVTTADIGWTASQYPGHAFILNEHGEYWINREGKAMSGTAGTWNAALPGVDDATRLTYYCDLMTAQMESFRAGRAYTGLLFFCGLASSVSSARGITSDILEPDISTAKSLSIHPYFKYLAENSFAPLGITVGTYTERRVPGEKARVPVTLINDTGENVENLDVTLVIKSGKTVLYAERRAMSVAAFEPGKSDGTATEVFDITVPAYRKYCKEGSVLTVQAFYNSGEKTVFSQRKWTLEGGTLTNDGLPGFGWLKADELPKEYVREDYIAKYEGGNDGGKDGEKDGGKDSGKDGNGLPAGKTFAKILPWVAGGLVLAGGVAAAAAMVTVAKKKKSNKK